MLRGRREFRKMKMVTTKDSGWLRGDGRWLRRYSRKKIMFDVSNSGCLLLVPLRLLGLLDCTVATENLVNTVHTTLNQLGDTQVH